MRQPDFRQLERVLKRETPDRPVLFEFFLNQRLYERLIAPRKWPDTTTLSEHFRLLIAAFAKAGYDYATVQGSSLNFPIAERDHAQTVSLNAGAVIHDRASFDAYAWPDVDSLDYDALADVADDLPAGMKLIVSGPGGVLENVISLVGYDNLCFMLVDDAQLVADIFAEVGSRLVRHYERAAAYDAVGACISNDDWGFKTQTMLGTEDMRRFVIPWHQRIAKAIHATGKPAILHSCGNLKTVMDDIIEVIGYDGKHSYEDVIQPVEDAYDQYHDRIAILGGIDLDFICRAPLAEITARSAAMLERAAGSGGYALGTGNSVPLYIDDDRYFAMTRAALESACPC